MVAPWSFRVVWPVEDDDAGYTEARAYAEKDIALIAEESGVKLLGSVEWSMVEHDQPDAWPHTQLALVAVADAVPARPDREQIAKVVEYYAGRGFNDREIGRELGISRDSVVHVRRKHRIPPGVPPCGQVRAA